jgi:hypothetical protein
LSILQPLPAGQHPSLFAQEVIAGYVHLFELEQMFDVQALLSLHSEEELQQPAIAI